MNRRDFLVRNGSLLALLNVVGCAGLNKEFFGSSRSDTGEELAIFWHGTRPGHDVLMPQYPSHLIFIDPYKLKHEIINIPVTTHSIVQDGIDPRRLYLISKWSREIALFERDKSSVTKTLIRPDHTRVYGHALWDEERKGIWFTEHDLKDLKGYLVFCDQNLIVKQRIESGGSMPHDIELSKNGRQFIVANSQGVGNSSYIPNMAFIDASSLKINKVIEIPQLHESGVITHMVQSKVDDQIFMGGYSLKNDFSVMVAFDNNGVPKLLPMDGNPHFLGESFSLVHNGQTNELLWVTPASGALFRWDLTSSKLAQVDLSHNFRNIHEFQNQYYLTTKADSGLHKKNPGIDKLLSIIPPAAGTWGVHMHTLKKLSKV